MYLNNDGSATILGGANNWDDTRVWTATCSGACAGLVGTWSTPSFYSGSITIKADYSDHFTTSSSSDHIDVCGLTGNPAPPGGLTCTGTVLSACASFPCVDLRQDSNHHHIMYLNSDGTATISYLGSGSTWTATCSGACAGLVGTWSTPSFYSGSITISVDYADDFTSATANDHIDVCGL
jgi:hypothetical protein